MKIQKLNSNAVVIMQGETDTLISYETAVCRCTRGHFERLWNGHSNITMKHVNQFREIYGLEKLNKKAWENLPCEEE